MSIFRKISSYFTLAISIVIAIATFFAAYAGHINPNSMSIAPLMCMTFPYWIIITLIMLPICFFVDKRFSLIPLISLIGCIGPILNICPLNIWPSNYDKNDAESFSLLSYNAYNFISYDNNYPNDDTNATLTFIAKTDADIVCLQECEYLSPLPRWHVYRKQVNEIKEQYPHIIIGQENGQSIFSKYPVTKVTSDGFFSHFVVDMPNHKLDIIDVHLRSIRLSDEDKKNYNEALSELIADNEEDSFSSWKNIASKVTKAAKQRARQAIAIKKYIDNIENDNIIVCGDFNDVPGCFAINTIADDDFDDVYRECGFGPMTTYHGSNLNFRIDHILYKGDFDATSFKRDKFNSSDHYPLYATFKWDND